MKNDPVVYHETWKAIAGILNRSERWCRYMASQPTDPLPVFKVGGIVRLNVADYEAWLERQRQNGRPKLKTQVRRVSCPRCGVVVSLRVDGTMQAHEVPGRSWECVGSRRSLGIVS